uniref:Uncharacterized protein n=1 Tax=Arundo donax TaxID=35708 RepID=A0A0A8ZZC7_ARUDO
MYECGNGAAAGGPSHGGRRAGPVWP